MGKLFHETDKGLRRTEFGLGRLQRHTPAIEDDEAIRNVEYVVDVVTDEQDRSPGFASCAC